MLVMMAATRAMLLLAGLAGCDRLTTPPHGDPVPIRDAFITFDAAVPHDEDLDGVPDARDNCPIHMNADQADTDADGVGDACDPRPQTPGDRVAFFDTFQTGARPEWQTLSGSWTLGNDAFHVAASGALHLGVAFMHPTAALITSCGEIPLSGQATIEIDVGNNPGTTGFVGIAARFHVIFNGSILEADSIDATPQTMQASASPGTITVVSAGIDGTVRGGAQTPPSMLTVPATSALPPITVGVATSDLAKTVDIDSVIVYDHD